MAFCWNSAYFALRKICGILVTFLTRSGCFSSKQRWGSVTFWCGSGSGSPDPYLWLVDPDPAPGSDQTPDPTPFFINFKDAKKIIFFTFFSHNVPTGTSSSVQKKNFLLKYCVKMLFLQALFQTAQDIFEKREGSPAGSGSAPPTIGSGSGSGRPKNIQIRIRFRIRIPNTGSKMCIGFNADLDRDLVFFSIWIRIRVQGAKPVRISIWICHKVTKVWIFTCKIYLKGQWLSFFPIVRTFIRIR